MHLLLGLIWSVLKKLLVREGRSSRQDFLLKGVAPLFLSLFAMLLVPASPGMGDFGGVLLVASIFLSRVALAEAIKRAHDMGMSDVALKSGTRQMQAGAQAFGAMLFITTFQQVNRAAPTALLFAAVGAAVIVLILLGGPKLFRALATTVGDLTGRDHGPAPDGTMAAYGIYSAAKQPVDPQQASALAATVQRPRPAAPAPRPAAESSPPRTRTALKVPHVGASSPPALQPAPQPLQPPVVHKRKRGAVGEWV